MMTTRDTVISIRIPQLVCFGCRLNYNPFGIETGAILHLQLKTHEPYVCTQDGPVYVLASGDLRSLLASADAIGWRKLTLYGQEIHICPTCRQRHPRTRPEWERHLTEEGGPVL